MGKTIERFFSLSKLPNVYKQKWEKKQRDFVLECPNINYHHLLPFKHFRAYNIMISFTHPPPPHCSIGRAVPQRGRSSPGDYKVPPPPNGMGQHQIHSSSSVPENTEARNPKYRGLSRLGVHLSGKRRPKPPAKYY